VRGCTHRPVEMKPGYTHLSGFHLISPIASICTILKSFPAADIELKVDQHGLNGYGWLRITSKGGLMIINVSEAKTHLSKLIDKVCLGEKVVIAKNNLPLVELVIHKSKLGDGGLTTSTGDC